MRKRRQAPRAKRIEGMAPEILDVEGAARLLGVSTRTIYKLAGERAIPAAKVGKEWRFSRKRLIEWVTPGSTHEKPGAEWDEELQHRASPPALGGMSISKPKRAFAERARLPKRSHALALWVTQGAEKSGGEPATLEDLLRSGSVRVVPRG